MAAKTPLGKTKSLGLLRQWAAAFLQRKDYIMDETDEQVLERLRDEVDSFIRGLESQWMGRRFERLTKANQVKLREIRRELRDLLIGITVRLEDAKQDRAILIKMESVEPPQDSEIVPERNLLKWVKDKFHYSRKFVSSIGRLPHPG